MRKDYEKLFSHLEPPEPPEGFLVGIMERIRKEQRLAALKRTFFITITALGSLISFIPAFNAMQVELVRSGLMQFLSLIISDPGIIFAVWNDFALSILESLPTLNIAIFLTVALIFVVSLRLLIKNINVIVFSKPFADKGFEINF